MTKKYREDEHVEEAHLSDGEELEVLRDKLAETNDQLDGSNDEIANLKAELNTAIEIAKSSSGLDWLEANCSDYRISRNRQSGKILVEGTIASKESGYITRYVPRIYRRNGLPPYQIREGDTYKHYRKVEFRYISTGETLDQAVQQIIITYAPGDVEVDTQDLVEDREYPYAEHLNLWVQVCDSDSVSLRDFRALPEAGTTEGYDLTNPAILREKVR